MRGIAGYGRYDDDPGHVGCPRAKSDMTPCIARDGQLAIASAPGGGVCVGCDQRPGKLLRELVEASMIDALGDPESEPKLADQLRDLVRKVTEP